MTTSEALYPGPPINLRHARPKHDRYFCDHGHEELRGVDDTYLDSDPESRHGTFSLDITEHCLQTFDSWYETECERQRMSVGGVRER